MIEILQTLSSLSALQSPFSKTVTTSHPITVLISEQIKNVSAHIIDGIHRSIMKTASLDKDCDYLSATMIHDEVNKSITNQQILIDVIMAVV